MSRRIYRPLALGLNIITYALNNLYLCPFIVTKRITKSRFENLIIIQMTVKEILALTGHLVSSFSFLFSALIGLRICF